MPEFNSPYKRADSGIWRVQAPRPELSCDAELSSPRKASSPSHEQVLTSLRCCASQDYHRGDQGPARAARETQGAGGGGGCAPLSRRRLGSPIPPPPPPLLLLTPFSFSPPPSNAGPHGGRVRHPQGLSPARGGRRAGEGWGACFVPQRYPPSPHPACGLPHFAPSPHPPLTPHP